MALKRSNTVWEKRIEIGKYVNYLSKQKTNYKELILLIYDSGHSYFN